MKIVKKNKTYFINIEQDCEEKILEPFLFSEVDAKQISTDVICLVKKSKQDNSDKTSIVGQTHNKPSNSLSQKEAIKNKIIQLLNDESLPAKEKIEGRFEELLKQDDQKVFKEMLLSKEVIIYKKVNYKKGIYKANDEKIIINKPKQEIENKQATADDIFDFFETEKYAVIIGIDNATKFSKRYEDLIKSNEIMGIKSFDGSYNIIDARLYDSIKKKILNLKLDKQFTLQDITSRITISQDLIKVTLEFMREECLLIEKKKGVYVFV